jgi:hypothetical protein
MFRILGTFLRRYYATGVAVKLHKDRGVYTVFERKWGGPRKCPDCTVFVQVGCFVSNNDVSANPIII